MDPSPPDSTAIDDGTVPSSAATRPPPRPWVKVVGTLGVALLVLVVAIAAWNVAIGNRRLLASAVAAAAAFGAWRGWSLLRHGNVPAGTPEGSPPPMPRW